MRLPHFGKLQYDREQGEWGVWSCARFMHPNPRFYKYYWWVFWIESPVDGRDFLGNDYRICTSQCADLLNEIREKRELCWLYSRRFPRNDPANPFDFSRKVWRGKELAPAFDDDPDPIAVRPMEGHK